MAIRNDYTVASPTNSGTFARSSTGYYWDGTNITSATSNTVRYEETFDVWLFDDLTSGQKTIGTYTTIKKGMLVEPQATNLVTNSDAFNTHFTSGAGLWTRSEDATEPDMIASNDPWHLGEDGSTGPHYRDANAISTTAGNDYCWSIFYKPYPTLERGFFLGLVAGGKECSVGFDPLNGIVRNDLGTAGDLPTHAGIIKYSNGWYRLFMTWTMPTGGTNCITRVGLWDGGTDNAYTGDGSPYTTGAFVAGWQFEAGVFPTSYIHTTGSTATRNADSNTYSYSTTVGSTGTTFGVVQTPFYPKNGNTVLQSDLGAAGSEYDVSIDYETDGDIVGSSTDPGTPTTVTLTHAFATGDEYKATYNQVEVNGSGDADQNLRFYVDNASVGTPAAHGIADGDALDGNHIIVNGYGGLLHKVAIDDTSDQSGNYDYLNLVVAVNYDVSISESITVGDTQAALAAALGAISDSITIGDTQAALAAALGSFAESITVGDTQSGLAGSFGSFAEGVTVGDAQSALASALGSVSESVLLTNLFSGLQLFLVSISEGISVGDTQSSVASALAAFSESITVGDTQTALAGALAALTEGVVTGDTQSGLATALAILAAENVNLNEVLTSLQVFLAYMTESITVGDSTSAEAAALAAFTESLAAGDAPSATATALAALSEGITNAEVFAAVAAAYASVNEGILVGETWSYPLIGAHLVATFSIEPLLAATTSNQPLLSAEVTTQR